MKLASGALAARVLSGLLLPLLVVAPALGQQEATTAEPAQELPLSLDEAIELALRHNLQVRISSMNPDIAEEQIRLARGRFDLLFTFDVPQAFQRSTQPQSSVLGGADVLSQELVSTGLRFGAQTRWGLDWAISASAQRFITNNEFSTFNPRYDTSLRLDVRQPLLRNFGSANERQIVVSQNDYSVSQELFRQQLQGGVLQVIQAYWSLVFQVRNVEVQELSLQLAREQLRRNNAMVRIGVLAAVDVIQTEQQVADAELSLIQAQIALQNQQDLLKRLLNLDAVRAEGWALDIVPTSEPATAYDQIDVDVAVLEALQKSPEIRQDRINLDSRRVDLSAARNQLLPSLDLVGSAQLSGLGGDRIFRAGDFGGSIVEVQEGGFDQSFQQLFSGDFRNWTVGVQIQMPVRNDVAKAQHAQASIRERQAVEQVADREILIRQLVQNAARNVEGGMRQVAAATNAKSLAEQQYAGELRRFETGQSSTFQVLSFQRQLTGARLRELNALIGLNQAIANFEQEKGALLDVYGIRVEDAGLGRRATQSVAPTPGSMR